MLMSIPSPSQGVWHLGPLPIRAYAICIIIGILAAAWVTARRWRARGGKRGEVGDILIWAIPGGLIGARLYHVVTDSELYFPHHPLGALEVWNGGLGIWGGVIGGVLTGVIGARRMGIPVARFMDAAAPTLLLGQGIGRWGNYFNQELFGGPTSLPWGLQISPEHRPSQWADVATFHPTFLYESLWDISAFVLLILLDRRFKFAGGRGFAAYVMAYTLGRFWIENLRVDAAVNGDHFLGLRFNAWTALVAFVAALAFFVVSQRREAKAAPEASAGDSDDSPPLHQVQDSE